jgi:hypothetical protein
MCCCCCVRIEVGALDDNAWGVSNCCPVAPSELHRELVRLTELVIDIGLDEV